jgi:hypothetical protein
MMDGFIIRSIAFGVLLPAVLAGVIALFGRQKLGAWAGAIGITVGFVAAYIGVQGTPPFIPRTVPELLPALALVGLLWAWLERFWMHSSALTWLLRLVPLGLLELFLYFRIFSGRITARFNPWTTGDIILNLTVPAVTVALLWVFLALALPPAVKATATDTSDAVDDNADTNTAANNTAANNTAANNTTGTVTKRSLAVVITVLIVLCSAIAVSLVLAGSAIVAQIVGALTAALGAIMVLAWLVPAPYISVTAAPTIALVLGNALALGGFFAATLPWYGALLLALTGLFLYLGRNRPFMTRLAVQLGGTAVLAALGVLIAWQTH